MKCSVSTEKGLGLEGKLWEQLENYSACEKHLDIMCVQYYVCLFYRFRYASLFHPHILCMVRSVYECEPGCLLDCVHRVVGQ